MATGYWKEEEDCSNSKKKNKRPTITPPARQLFGSGGLSPGPMTLVSRFFSDESNYQSFSQLLAGAMTSPPPPPLFLEDERTAFSPSAFLNSPAAFFSPPFLKIMQSPFGISHQQALAQVTAQAVLAQSQMHVQPEYQASAESLAYHQSLTQDEALQQQLAPSNSDPQSAVVEPSEVGVSHSDGKHLQVQPSVPADDGYNWRKYGQKPIKGSEYPRSYYKCTHLNCLVKKKVERSSDGQIAQIVYKNEHNHEKPHTSRRSKDATDVNGNMNSHAKPELVVQGPAGNFANQASENVHHEYNQAAPIHLPNSSDSEEQGNADNRKKGGDDEPNPKRRNVGESEVSMSHKTVTEPKIIVQTRSEVDLLDDGYRWRKYGQKVVKGNPHPRSYYKCTHAGCNVRKHVERAPTDSKAVITTYEGKHNHEVPAARNSSHNAANNSAPQMKPNTLVTNKHPLLKDMDFGNNDRRPVLLQLKEEQLVV
ncbi:hypothetical protein Ddye_008831 [Dipteronia dyeriana]|uniref:WRKY domain-containing protein n=1 Tax=Dipteronia dyeriana TaxID=168575 RepID=A0AAE0CLS4_9ROSI|nr:hypothetical protein Ddye_008831 [Dipteronia dyeriana]